MNKSLPRVSHRPFGLEHPYQQDPDERFPRRPMHNEPVRIGVRCFPSGAIAKLWAVVELDGKSFEVQGQLTIKGGSEEEIFQFATSTLRLGDVEIGDSWKIELPPTEGGTDVRYKIMFQSDSGNEAQVMEGETFEYTTRRWWNAGKITNIVSDEGSMTIDFTNSEYNTHSKLAFSLDGAKIKNEWVYVGTSAAMTAMDGNLSKVWENAEFRIDVNADPYSIKIFKSGKEVLSSLTIPEWLFENKADPPKACRVTWNAAKGEKIFGTGERFCSFDLRGQRVESKVYEQYKDQGVHTYLPVPFYLSSAGYASYVDTKRRVNYDFGSATVMTVDLGKDKTCTNWIYLGDGPKQNISAFVQQVGLPVMPADWAFGHWMSSNEWNDQATILKQLELSKEHDIPASVIVIEAWSDETTFYVWNDAKYTAKPSDQPLKLADFTFPADGKWPDPKGMTDELHANGVKLVLWQNPIMKYIGDEVHEQQAIDERYMLENGHHIKWQDGSPYRVRPFWFNQSLLMDFSSPQAVEWWMAKREYLLNEIGIDGFKTDGGEHLWGDDVVFSNGMSGDEGINEYPNQYVHAYFKYANERRNGQAITFSRAGFTGAQRFPCHWAGDENSTWKAFRASFQAGMNANVSGIPFWGWDIGGFSGEIPTAELYLRGAAMAAFCPIMQFHSEYNGHRQPLRDRTPWNIAERTGDPRVLEIYRAFVKHRYGLLDYILKEAKHCSKYGEPMMRPLFLDHPEDPTAWQVEDQYYFGRKLLVAPIFTEGATERKVYLPHGSWKDHWTGKQIPECGWIDVPAPLDTIPVFERSGE